MSTDYTSLDHRVIDAAIASRVCGWTLIPDGEYGERLWRYVGSDGNRRVAVTVPAYSTDYNAVHEALGKLTDAQLNLLSGEIGRLYLTASTWDLTQFLHALRLTPRQICEAILEALDKEAAR